MHKSIIYLTFIYFLTILPFAQVTSAFGESFRSISHANQLYGNRINDILEDNEGYLWVGTNKGLFRYDGQQLQNIDASLPKSTLNADYLQVSSIQEDANHHLWVARSNMSNYLVFNSGRKLVDTDEYLHRLGVNCKPPYLVQIGQQGDLWCITTDSLFHYNFGNGVLHRFHQSNIHDFGKRPLSARGCLGKLYVLDGNNLFSFYEHNASWTEEVLPLGIPDMGKTENVMSSKIFIAPNNGMWIYSIFAEDIIYRGQKEHEWKHVKLPSVNKVYSYESDELYQNCIIHLTDDGKDGLWIATNNRGLIHYSPETDTFVQYAHDPKDSNTIAANNVSRVLRDRHGTLWVGYYAMGMSFCHSSLDNVKLHFVPTGDVTSLFVTPDGTRWIGTSGLGLWKQSGERYTKVEGMPNITVADLKYDDGGRLWIASYDHGLYELELQSGRVKHYTAADGSLPHDGASRIAIDGNHRLWICSSLGSLYSFDPATRQSQIYSYPTGNRICGDAICYDASANRIIMATYWNLWIHNLDNDSAYVMTGLDNGKQPFHSTQMSNICNDLQSHIIWMSHGKGISGWDTKSDSLILLCPKDYGHLPTDIQSICLDNEHQLWVSGTSSAAIIMPQYDAEGQRRFLVRNLPFANDPTNYLYNFHSIAFDPKGSMLFGNTEGYVEFLPQLLSDLGSESEAPLFSTILLGDSIISLSPMASEQRRLELDYDHAPLKVHFFSGTLQSALEGNYSYRLRNMKKGTLENWNETPLNYIQLHSLSPGEYVMELRIMGLNSDWSPICSLPIVVNDPWWFAVPMRCLYGVLALLCIVTVAYFTRRQQRKRMLAEREQLIREHESQLSQLTIAPMDEQFLNKVINQVDEHLQEADFGVESLASGVGMSRSLLYKKMMAVTGRSPLDFIRTLRMRRAAAILLSSSMQVSEVGYQVGYNTPKIFTDNFKQVYGMTPSEYRKKNAENNTDTPKNQTKV